MSDSTEIVAPKTLEERVKEKLHESIGDLIKPEDIKTIVKRGIDDFLFKPRVKEVNSSWSREIQTKVSLVQELIEKHLQHQVTTQVEKWIRDNPVEIKKMIQSAMSHGVGTAILNTLNRRFECLFENAIQNMKDQGML